MKKELQDYVWKHCLPKEFKEEVTKMWDNDEEPISPTAAYILTELFGIHNLTSDAEGEDEILTVSRKQVQNLYNYHKSRGHHLAGESLIKLFGSKCLPDEVADEDNFASKKPKYHVGQIVKLKDKGYGFEVTAVKKRDDCDEYQYKLAGWRPSFRESDLEPRTEP